MKRWAARRRGLIWAVLALIAIFIVLVLLYFFRQQWRGLPQGKGVAELTFKHRRVEARRAGKINWQNAVIKQNFFDGDAVKTATAAAAVIRFINAESIRVDENSLVIIRAPEAGTGRLADYTLEILSGAVQVTPKKSGLRIQSPVGTATVRPAPTSQKRSDVIIRVEEDQSLSVAALEGKTITAIANKTLEIKKGEAVLLQQTTEVTPEAVIELPSIPTLMQPLDQAEFVLLPGQQAEKIELTVPVLAEQSHIQVSRDVEFNDLVLNRYGSDSTWTLEGLTAGTYYWRAAAVDAQNLHGPFTAPRSFTVSPAPPQPPVDTVLNVIQLLPSAQLFQGESTTGSAIKTGTQINGGQRLSLSPNGVVQLAFVADESTDLQLRSFSQVRFHAIQRESDGRLRTDLELQRGAMIIAIEPKREKVIQHKVRIGEAVFRFSQQNVIGNKRVEIFAEKLSSGQYRLVVLRGGYSFDIGGKRALLAGEQIDNVSGEGGSADIASMAMPVTADSDTTVFYRGEMPLLSFSAPAGRQPARFEISRNAQFTQVVLSEPVVDDNLTTILHDRGRYYWRYYGKDDKPYSTRLLKIQREENPPGLGQPLRVTDNALETIAYYFGIAPQIQWRWQRHPRAVGYQLELFADPDLAKRIFTSERIRQPQLDVVIDAIRFGEYFWRVKYLDYRGRHLETSSVYKIHFRFPEDIPAMVLLHPQTNLQSSKTKIRLRGLVHMEGGRLDIAGKPTPTTETGEFYHTTALKPGENLVQFRLRHEDGSVTISQKKVFVF